MLREDQTDCYEQLEGQTLTMIGIYTASHGAVDKTD